MGERASDRSPDRRPAWLPLAAAGLVVPTVLAGVTLLWPRQQIESDLAAQANQALAAAGFTGASLQVSGRDATISGVTEAEQQRALAAVEGINGIRVAAFGGPADQGAVPAPAEPPVPPAAAPPPAVPAEPAPAEPPAPVTAAPAELDATAKQNLQAGISKLLAASPITFGPNVPDLTAQGRATVGDVLALLVANPGAKVQIDGYVATGPGDGRFTAQQLSDRRAGAVRDALVAGGVPAGQITARGLGEGTNPAMQAAGRRVEITVV
ncbi:OmpA family protein [Pseudonocardia sp. TRM90224]|uniref:OmpA family protein n=1 Tax=Pseudonocardia sp. TRM90224 TaxID=2812678 RepID=UPI0027E02496|nr:OmpA family protein [Pseudonocardia sp. TRM90224]